MSHYGQRVEVWDDGKWRPGTTDRSDGWVRVVLDEGPVIWVAPFYIRPLEES